MSRWLLAAATSVLVVGFAVGALTQQRRELNLRGNRFKPLTWDELTPEQQAMVNDLLSGTRTSLNGPFNATLRSPEMGNMAQKLGEYLRFRTSVPARLNEMAILMTAQWWSSQYEWVAHRPLAVTAGLSAAVIDAIQAGQRPARMQPDEAVVYDFVTELHHRRRVSDATFAATAAVLGEKGIVDLIAVLGYYDMVAMMLNVDRYPLPSGTAPPFPEPK
jgi:4-carboxymuconolactone decarboxylase